MRTCARRAYAVTLFTQAAVYIPTGSVAPFAVLHHASQRRDLLPGLRYRRGAGAVQLVL